MVKRGNKRKKDPNAPKRGLSAYFFWMAEHRDAYIAEHPDAKFVDVGKAMGEMWRNLDEEEKEEYIEKAAEDKVRYQNEMAEYEALDAYDDDDDGYVGKSKKGRAKKDPNAPKKGMSAYFFYMGANRAAYVANNPDAKFGEVGRAMGEQWRSLSESQKAQWNAMAAKDKIRAARELEEYHASQY